jgi:uncharacterized membrane protein YfcA
LSTDQLIIFGAAICAAAAFLQGAIGFGYGIAGMALLTGLLGMAPADASVLITIGGAGPIVLTVTTLSRTIRWRVAGVLIAGLAVGVPLGVSFLATADATLLTRALGIFVLLFSIWSLLRHHPPKPHPRGLAASLAVGIFSGVLAGAFCAPGPTLVAFIYSQPWDRDALKSTVNLCFLSTVVFRLASILWEGLVTTELMIISWWCLVASSIAVLVGLGLVRYLSTENFKRATWVVFGVLGFLLVIRG